MFIAQNSTPSASSAQDTMTGDATSMTAAANSQMISEILMGCLQWQSACAPRAAYRQR